jgi:carbamoyl-phosphate synthase small subunit
MPKSTATPPSYATAALVLADGKVFFGQGIGAKGTTLGEICFNTGMTGYQEILTDPSYAGQIITFTFPHIGNTGANAEDIESAQPCVRGLIVREPITPPSNYRHQDHFQHWLQKNNIIGISGIDTRALTRYIRHAGAQNAIICHVSKASKLNIESLLEKVKAHPSLEGMELAKSASVGTIYPWKETTWCHTHGYSKPLQGPAYKVVAIDYGAKLNILRHLACLNCEVIVVPSTTSAQEILAYNPDGVFLSNGPGDPFATGQYALAVLQELIAKNIPIFGICLGHQLLALAMGCKTTKMPKGHRGSNHPVLHLASGRVEITSQNHGFVVDETTLPKDAKVTHRSLFDQTIEGLEFKDKTVFSVQYHPESSPGPHDSQYLFQQFVTLMENHKRSHSTSNSKSGNHHA